MTVIANESYDDFAKKLQSELEEDFGIRFGKIDKYAFAKIPVTIEGELKELGKEKSEVLWNELLKEEYIDDLGVIQE